MLQDQVHGCGGIVLSRIPETKEFRLVEIRLTHHHMTLGRSNSKIKQIMSKLNWVGMYVAGQGDRYYP